jgi:hypothetical protein
VTGRVLALGLLGLALAGCPFHPRAPLPGPGEGEWGQVRVGATRRGSLYDGLVHRATATATHLGLAEREARARRLAVWLGWTPEELERQLAAERAEAAAGEEFLIALYTAERRTNDLDAPRSVWRLAVQADEGALVATKVEAIDADATITGLFPYVGVFDTVYRVKFPTAPGGPLDGRQFVLELSSALGKIVLDFGAPAVAEAPF